MYDSPVPEAASAWLSFVSFHSRGLGSLVRRSVRDPDARASPLLGLIQTMQYSCTKQDYVTESMVEVEKAPARNSIDRLLGIALRPYCVRLKPLTLDRGVMTSVAVGLARLPPSTPGLLNAAAVGLERCDVKLRLSELLSESKL